MKNYKQEKRFRKIENNYFELLKLSQERELIDQEKIELLKVMYERINFLEEEFLTARGSCKNSKEYIAINNGLTLISDLKNGLKITSENFIQANVEQWAAHFECIRNYEECFIAYRKHRTMVNFENMIDLFMDIRDYLDGYQPKKTLTKKD